MHFRLSRGARFGLAPLFLAAAFAYAPVIDAGAAGSKDPDTGLPSQPEQAARPAAATDLIGANDFDAILKMAKGYGDASLTTVENGDPVIVGTINGTSYQLFFIDCTDHRDCKTLDFYAIWDQRDIDLDTINTWNSVSPYNKAYLTDDGLPVVELNHSTVGLTEAALSDTFDRWTITLAEFPREVLYAAQ
ncbi:YbjN domain-containing protein [Aurantimonas sp. VKM B-3413]|uniref:YbjN domain-containing protein n=1 Tax=Aurantimonas sp. VKM B-3413 TaxID=2779401 RepID=UPI001E4EE456|nr:YbjN domain-containing protein [Aurantimonas sp. VKM B-3413]MCB8837887.1 YbjN domain-containing protein [Aurantimonas sp. VKM B-3413]